MLAKFPDIGRPRPEFAEPDLRFWNVYRYFIAYKEESGHIEVIAIIHTSRDIPALLADRFTKDTA
jgi:plasmid stabilization system protein ParE